jgi:hypothetical protein
MEPMARGGSDDYGAETPEQTLARLSAPFSVPFDGVAAARQERQDRLLLRRRQIAVTWCLAATVQGFAWWTGDKTVRDWAGGATLAAALATLPIDWLLRKARLRSDADPSVTVTAPAWYVDRPD